MSADTFSAAYRVTPCTASISDPSIAPPVCRDIPASSFATFSRRKAAAIDSRVNGGSSVTLSAAAR